MYEIVKSGLVHERPRHHYSSAYNTNYHPDASSIFVVEHSRLLALDPEYIKEIFRDCHILVTGVPTEEMGFDLTGLSSLGSLVRPVAMQGEINSVCRGMHRSTLSCVSVGQLKGSDDADDILMNGTLTDMY